MTEIEIKLRIEDPKAARTRLLALGAIMTRERHTERDSLFDFADGALRRSGTALRLRAAGRRATLTFKGPRQKSRSFKVREEFETQVQDPRQTRLILRSLGLREVFAYEKKRTVLRKGRVTVSIDELPFGSFLELEGERHEIVRLARSLGYRRTDFITRDYVEMARGA